MAQVAKLKALFEAMPDKIDGVTGVEWGRNDSSEHKNQGYTHCVLMTFANEEGRESYLPHPEHEALKQVFRPILEDGMRIYDIADINNPVFVRTISMENPKGIALDGEHLFVCEKFNGLTVFELSNQENPELIYKSDEFGAFDLIPASGLLMVVGPDTLHQFDYTDINNIFKIGEYSLRD